MLNIALVQMNSGPDITENIQQAETLIRRAADDGAQFILTPENSCHMRAKPADRVKNSPSESEHAMLYRFTVLAQELRVCLLLGSIAIRVSEDKISNRSYLIGDDGNIVAKYNKIHLFDAFLPNDEHYYESATVQPGIKPALADMPFGRVGMTICYDLRFPYLYRALAKAGASIITVPSAFTVPTGKAHWEVLLRARAIETGCFILAPAQSGEHEGGRLTWGHSMVVSPWGEVIARAGEGIGLLKAKLDLSKVEEARKAIPSLLHDRQLGDF